ncbi:TM2 domain-containing protein 2 precursor [Tepidicaulis marinus]|uniref:TM2 domain-containing protein 2 n=1 Tax=Tepidicaulis marinus TaxID=1333998 RepID=A0A081BE81_9HYPH|nr:hypothetical protein [Tepidicaulis marinus]GAK46349.1 TM2 domain-containing protein 2 precursor [Tepidicaulis marinus]
MKPVEESAKEMLEMEMPFRINPETLDVESDDSRIYMIGGRSAGPEQGHHFVLHVGDKVFGFCTAADRDNEKTELLDDGTRVWWFNDLLCPLSGAERKAGGGYTAYRVLTNTYSFTNLEEQKMVLGLFFKAIQAFDPRVAMGTIKEPKVVARLTPHAAFRLESGDFLA